jgi:hypothetical protein
VSPGTRAGWLAVIAADLPVLPPVPSGSMQQYALASMRNYAQMALFEGCSDDQLFDVVADAVGCVGKRRTANMSAVAARQPDACA